MRNYFLGLCLLFALCFTACSHSDDSVDVLIIGGGASGVTAGIQSARMGAATLIVEETEWLGGMLTVEEIWNEFELKDFDMNRGILRSEMAILIDQILDPFNNKKVDITGQYIQ